MHPPREHPWLAGTQLEPYAGRLFLSVAEVARLMQADPRTIHRAIELEQLEAVRLSDATVRVPAVAVWRLAGLDPETLRPRHDDGGLDTATDSEAGAQAIVHVLHPAGADQ